MYHTILVPLDGSPFAEHALPVAAALARRAGAELYLVHVTTPLTEAYVEGLAFSATQHELEVSARQLTYLEATARKLRQKADLPVRLAVHHGDVAERLCELLQAGEADLVVMATHARGAIGRFWLGSVADEVLRHTTAPLLLVRPDGGAADLGHEPDLGKVVVPLDGTAQSEKILEPATRLAAVIPGCQLVLLRAVRPIPEAAHAVAVPEIDQEVRALTDRVAELQGELRADAQGYLDGVAGRLRSRGFRVTTEVVVDDSPEAAILDEADHLHAGMIALETEGRSGLSRLLHGSVAEKVLRGSHVPVLLQRAEAT